MRNSIFILLGSSLFLFACLKKEIAVPKHDPGDVITASVNIGSDYKWQIYYNLETNSVVGQNVKTAWDLAFENGTSGNHILLNGSKLMFAYNTGNTNFAAVTDTNGFTPNSKCDYHTGDLTKTAIGNWVGTNHVYIIDRGYNELGIHQGFRKIQFLNVDATKYQVKFAQLNGTNEVTLDINKNDDYNYSFLSFTTSNTLLIEPKKDNWDIVFTQYTYTFMNPYHPYLVSGCLLNSNNTKAITDSITTFANISNASIPNYTFSDDINEIGYRWKEFDGTNYTVNINRNFLIHSKEGYYYKIHFIDFYNDSGEKGYPKFEYQKL